MNRGGVSTGIVLLSLGVLIILRTVRQDFTGRTLADRFTGKKPDPAKVTHNGKPLPMSQAQRDTAAADQVAANADTPQTLAPDPVQAINFGHPTGTGFPTLNVFATHPVRPGIHRARARSWYQHGLLYTLPDIRLPGL